MAAIRLEPGEVTVRLHCGVDLVDKDWFGKQDPYVKLRCGKIEFRSNTHKCGGKRPVWDQSFTFKVDQETKIELRVYDEDTGKVDDRIGKGEVEIVTLRSTPGRRQDIHVPLFRRLSKRQHGHIYVTLTFTPTNRALAATSLTPSAASSEDLYSVHSRQDEANKDAAAQAAAANAAQTTTTAAAAAWSADVADGLTASAGSSLASGLVAPGSLPDTVPSCAPTCGLITPQPHQLLPCHLGKVSGSIMAPPSEAASQHQPSHPGNGPGGTFYPDISSHAFDLRFGSAAPEAAAVPAPPGAGPPGQMPPPVQPVPMQPPLPPQPVPYPQQPPAPYPQQSPPHVNSYAPAAGPMPQQPYVAPAGYHPGYSPAPPAHVPYDQMAAYYQNPPHIAQGMPCSPQPPYAPHYAAPAGYYQSTTAPYV